MPSRMSTGERQAEIVAAALRLASRSSPAAVTTADIAEVIGITQGAVFKHFATKDAIWQAAMRWVHGELLGSLQHAAASAPGPLDALAAMFRAHVDFVASQPGVPRVIFHELQQPGDTPAKAEVRVVLQGYRRLLLGVLRRAIDDGQVAGDLDREAAATAFLGLVQGLVMQSMLVERPAAMRAQADRLFALYRRGLGAAR